jgi:predicted aspartyl protease
MEIATVGRVTVPAKIENLGDLLMARRGLLPADQVRAFEVSDALVDTGATMLSLPRRYIAQLGLSAFRTRTVRTAAGTISLNICDAVRLTVQGRECTIDVAEVPDECPVLIGQVPLEVLDFVVDPQGQRLIGNPAHGGEQMIEMYGFT